MSEAELIFTALAELSTRQIAESEEATGMSQNTAAAKTGGQLAGRARLELEARTGKTVVSSENFRVAGTQHTPLPTKDKPGARRAKGRNKTG